MKYHSTLGRSYRKLQPHRRRFPLVCLGLILVFAVWLVGSFPQDKLSVSTHSGLRAMTTPVEQRSFSSPQDIPMEIVESLDAIVVLGGGVPESWKLPPVYVLRRADDAVQVLQRRKKSSVDSPLPILCLSAGTAHLPQLLSPNGLPIWESTACAAYLSTQHKIPSEDLFVETTSFDTIGNAFYTRTSHTEWNGWRKLLVITNDFHMSRTAAIFDWIFLLLDGNPQQYQLFYLSSENVGLSEEAVRARKQREDQSAINVRERLSQTYTTLPEVYNFMTTKHSLYSAGQLVERAQGVQDDEASIMVKKSYGAASKTT